jgi:hypothetical protein
MIGTIVVGLILAIVIFAIVFKMVKDKKNGKSSCNCGCSHCASSSVCHKSKKKK